MPRLGQQEETNLSDMGAGRDMDQVILALGIEWIRAREVVKRTENLVEIPRVANLDMVGPHFGFWRDASNIFAGTQDKIGVSALMEQLDSIDQQLFVLTE